MAIKAKEAGALYVGGEELVHQVTENAIEYTHVLASNDMMGIVRKCAKVLGPKGLMPNAKLGNSLLQE